MVDPRVLPLANKDVRQLKGITATYRMTNKPTPVRHSPYVSGVLGPLKAFLEGEYAAYLAQEGRKQLLLGASERITSRYHELASDLVSVARRTESSLQKIRQGAQRRAAASSDASDNNISELTRSACSYSLMFGSMDTILQAMGLQQLTFRRIVPCGSIRKANADNLIECKLTRQTIHTVRFLFSSTCNFSLF